MQVERADLLFIVMFISLNQMIKDYLSHPKHVYIYTDRIIFVQLHSRNIMNNPCVSWPLNSRLTFGEGNPKTSRDSSSCHSDLAKNFNSPRFDHFFVVSTKEHLIYYEIHCCMNYHQKTIRCVKPEVKLTKTREQMVFHTKYQFP